MTAIWSESDHQKLTAVIFREAGRRSNAIAAASIMFEALDDARDAPAARIGLTEHFTGPLLDKLLKAIGEAPSTDKEQRI